MVRICRLDFDGLGGDHDTWNRWIRKSRIGSGTEAALSLNINVSQAFEVGNSFVFFSYIIHSDSMVEYRVLDTRTFLQIFKDSKIRVTGSSNRAFTSMI